MVLKLGLMGILDVEKDRILMSGGAERSEEFLSRASEIILDYISGFDNRREPVLRIHSPEELTKVRMKSASGQNLPSFPPRLGTIPP